MSGGRTKPAVKASVLQGLGRRRVGRGVICDKSEEELVKRKRSTGVNKEVDYRVETVQLEEFFREQMDSEGENTCC